MAMLDRIQGLFKKDVADEADLTHASQQDMAELAAARLAPTPADAAFAESRMASDESLLADDAG